MNEIPPLPSIPVKNFFARYCVLGKIAGIAVLALIQLIPLLMLDGLLTERVQRRDDATRDITSIWGSNQQVIGPVLVVPYRYFYTEKQQVVVKGQTVLQNVEVPHEDVAYFLPATLKIDGQAATRRLQKGIYQAVVYDTTLQISGNFSPPDFAAFKLGKFEIEWDKATLSVPILDLRGAEERLTSQLGDQQIDMLPGSALSFYPQGIHADLPNLKAITAPIPFHLQLTVRGSGDLLFAPLGMENVVHLTSAWPDPSFHGAFLPAERSVTPQGFDATWKVSYYGRNFPQQWRAVVTTIRLDDLASSYFGVSFLTLIDSYRNVERSIRYGILFIALIFVTFFLFEVLARLRLHLIQYGLVSAALVIFYLALLSLSEFVNFGLAYIVAAGLSTLLVAGYCSRILRHWKLTAGISGGLISVYGALYVILQLEDYSLLVGTALLAAALAAVMYATRNVNWYGTAND